MLQGCITAIVTPFFEDGSIDFQSLTKFTEWQIDSGVSGLVVVGSTGEAAALSNSEKLAVIRHVAEVNRGRVALIVGSGAAATAATLEFIGEVNQLSAVDYLMCLVPYYVKPTQNGLYQHFAAVAKHSKFPVILYNVPARTACNLDDDTVLRLARDFSNIVAIKDATGDLKRCTYLMAHKPEHFILLSGDDFSAVTFMLSGGAGVISVASNIRPSQFSKMCAHALAGERDAALAINKQLLSLYDALFCESNPIPVKWALCEEQQIACGTLRLPLTELSTSYHSRFASILEQIQ
ncbi:MAG: 4-hydroxy-tetrahydrodipicolinate synthase [Burkholderiales bacterium]|nr:4-hydroxy-tetrahydrodipicolinate synthase [Burkholderiales bacterium]